MHAFAVHLMKLKNVDRTIMSNRLKRMWKETIVGYLKVLAWHYPRETEENHKRCRHPGRNVNVINSVSFIE